MEDSFFHSINIYSTSTMCCPKLGLLKLALYFWTITLFVDHHGHLRMFSIPGLHPLDVSSTSFSTVMARTVFTVRCQEVAGQHTALLSGEPLSRGWGYKDKQDEVAPSWREGGSRGGRRTVKMNT